MILLRNLCFGRNGQLLVEDASLQLHPGWKVGLIGANGSGKSSFLALLRDELHAESRRPGNAARLGAGPRRAGHAGAARRRPRFHARRRHRTARRRARAGGGRGRPRRPDDPN